MKPQPLPHLLLGLSKAIGFGTFALLLHTAISGYHCFQSFPLKELSTSPLTVPFLQTFPFQWPERWAGKTSKLSAWRLMENFTVLLWTPNEYCLSEWKKNQPHNCVGANYGPWTNFFRWFSKELSRKKKILFLREVNPYKPRERSIAQCLFWMSREETFPSSVTVPYLQSPIGDTPLPPSKHYQSWN